MKTQKTVVVLFIAALFLLPVNPAQARSGGLREGLRRIGQFLNYGRIRDLDEILAAGIDVGDFRHIYRGPQSEIREILNNPQAALEFLASDPDVLARAHLGGNPKIIEMKKLAANRSLQVFINDTSLDVPVTRTLLQ